MYAQIRRISLLLTIQRIQRVRTYATRDELAPYCTSGVSPISLTRLAAGFARP